MREKKCINILNKKHLLYTFEKTRIIVSQLLAIWSCYMQLVNILCRHSRQLMCWLVDTLVFSSSAVLEWFHHEAGDSRSCSVMPVITEYCTSLEICEDDADSTYQIGNKARQGLILKLFNADELGKFVFWNLRLLLL